MRQWIGRSPAVDFGLARLPDAIDGSVPGYQLGPVCEPHPFETDETAGKPPGGAEPLASAAARSVRDEPYGL